MSDAKHPDPLDDLLADTILRMAERGLVRLEGDRVILTEKGRAEAQKLKHE